MNGQKILTIWPKKEKEVNILIYKDCDQEIWKQIDESTIESIVTKEQYANIEYKVEK